MGRSIRSVTELRQEETGGDKRRREETRGDGRRRGETASDCSGSRNHDDGPPILLWHLGEWHDLSNWSPGNARQRWRMRYIGRPRPPSSPKTAGFATKCGAQRSLSHPTSPKVTVGVVERSSPGSSRSRSARAPSSEPKCTSQDVLVPCPQPGAECSSRIARRSLGSCPGCGRQFVARKTRRSQRVADSSRLLPSHFTPQSSTSKTSVALGGMTPLLPASPYPSAAGITSFRRPPTFIPATPSSQPAITWPRPSGKM